MNDMNEEEEQFLRRGSSKSYGGGGGRYRPIDLLITILLVGNLVCTIAIAAFVFAKISSLEESITGQIQGNIQSTVNSTIDTISNSIKSSIESNLHSLSSYLTLIPDDIPQLANYLLHSNYTTMAQTLVDQLKRFDSVANATQMVGEYGMNQLNTTIQVLELIASIPPLQYDPVAANYTPSNWLSGLVADAMTSANTILTINNTALQEASLSCVEWAYNVQTVNWTYSIYVYQMNYTNYNASGWEWEPINQTPTICNIFSNIIQVCSAIFNNTEQYSPTNQTLPTAPANSLCS